MKRIVFILTFLLLVCCFEVNAQVVMVTPDSLTLYQRSLRENIKPTEPNNANLRVIATSKKKGANPIKGNVTVLYDPKEPTKKATVIKTLPK
jgi:hypothetical protein